MVAGSAFSTPAMTATISDDNSSYCSSGPSSTSSRTIASRAELLDPCDHWRSKSQSAVTWIHAFRNGPNRTMTDQDQSELRNIASQGLLKNVQSLARIESAHARVAQILLQLFIVCDDANITDDSPVDACGTQPLCPAIVCQSIQESVGRAVSRLARVTNRFCNRRVEKRTVRVVDPWSTRVSARLPTLCCA